MRLGRYLLLEKIGQGGMAEVFAARLEGPQQFARECVVKRLRPELAQMPQQVRLFLDEARLSAMLVHPCVVQVFDVGEAPREGVEGLAPDVFFAMERVDGPPLSRLLEVLRAAREPMPLEVCAWIGARVAEGLHFAHELLDRSTSSLGGAPKPLHIVHRDVSPQNVLLGSGGEVKVADFGIAKADVEHRPQTRVGVTKGKLAYMSPEQARGEKLDRRTDVYALGVVLWEMLAGRALYEDLADRRRQEALRRSPKAPAPSTVRPEVDEVLDGIVAAALAPAAKDRTSDCRGIEEALEAWLADHDEGSSARVALQHLLIDHAEALSTDDDSAGTKPHGVDAIQAIPPVASKRAGVSDRPEGSLPTRRPAERAAVAREPTHPRVQPRVHPHVHPEAKTLVKKMPLADDDEQTRPMMDAIVDGPAMATPAVGAPAPVAAQAPLVPAKKRNPRVAVKAAGRAAVPLPASPDDGARLPAPATSFVGRRAELERVGALFDDGARLVTLLGPGGTGKTRLALRFAEISSPKFPGGVWFADLTGSADDATAQAAIARALGVSLRAGRTPLEAQAMLGHALAALGRTLVVADNCDALAACNANIIADLARRSPRTRFLVTSEQVLRAAGEHVLEVAPLGVTLAPITGALRAAALLEDGTSDAVELFLDRARAARNGRALSDAARGVVKEIVKRLDGVPLAIELAAARAATETPAEILERLGRLGDQVQTLKSAIGETWAQLADDERRAFRQAAVFRGGFDTAAADAIFELGDDEPRAVDVLERLKGRSLVVARPSPFGARYTMLEALRAFANERLDEAGERTGAEARHAGYYTSLGKKLAHALGDPARGAPAERTVAEDGVEVLSLESANLTAVVDRAAALARPSTAVATLALEAALALEPMLGLRASAAEQLGILDKALTVAEGRGVDDALRLRGYLARGEARRLLGSIDQARADLQQAIDLAAALDDKSAEGKALAGLGALALSQGKLELADETLAQALALAEQARDDVTSGRILAQLGKVSRMRRRLDEAEARTRRAVELSRGAGDARSAGRALVELASVLLAKQMLDDAALSASAATQILDALHDRRSLVHAWGTLAIIELDRRRFDEADGAAGRAVDLAAHVGERRANGLYLGIRACALHAAGDLIEARELYGQAAKALFDVGEDGHGAFFSAGLGAVHAALDDVPAATAAFAAAERRLRGAERPLLQRAVTVLEGLLLLAKAGDDGARDAARGEVKRRTESARVVGFEQSEEVRFAVRLVDEAARR